MSNGYGYKNQVSPVHAGPYQGYGYVGHGNYPYPAGGQQPAALPATMQAQAFPMQAQTMPMPQNVPSGSFVTPAGGNIVTVPGVEESYVENILRLNRGKMATFYMTYENNREWNAKIFKGIVEAAGRDHIIISDPTTGMRYLLLMLNLDYVTFDEPIAYEYPFNGGVVSSSTPLGMATLGTVNAR
ncbi:spore coat protein GerQ [Paenibacillus alkaliterrae]|uniref:spore coat protein GerQ n=1 Tax=Paenibacillus alkaliterrae TaxID=320909 RepID=UPI001F3A31C7|nr:spore coat protein GerQ [Paenibacillus alkaliterrae]MCF2937860.1 spore coat protein GerQ [Paenibacillus alkaliterrae]